MGCYVIRQKEKSYFFYARVPREKEIIKMIENLREMIAVSRREYYAEDSERYRGVLNFRTKRILTEI